MVSACVSSPRNTASTDGRPMTTDCAATGQQHRDDQPAEGNGKAAAPAVEMARRAWPAGDDLGPAAKRRAQLAERVHRAAPK